MTFVDLAGRARRWVVVLLTVLCGTVAAEDSGPADDAEVQGQIRLFSAWLDAQLAYRGIPGVVVGVVAGDDLVWAEGFGHADVERARPMATDTRFRMASHSKLFTATAIMQLREEGLVRLDDPVVDHLPWFDFEAAEGDETPVTVEHLLTHASGLPREAGTHWVDFEFPSAEDVRALMPERRAAFPPETRWKYSNLAYTLAGLVVEARSGASWADYVEANVFDPLGMDASSVDVDDPLLAVGYGRRMPDGSREVLPFVDARGMAAATGLTSTVEDMARFVSAQFREGARGEDRILSTASLREMHRVRMLENDWSRGQGIGFSVNRVNDRLYVAHGGGYPGYTTFTSIQLDDEVGVIVLTNTNDSGPGQIATELMKTVGAAVAQAVASAEEEDEGVEWDPAWSRFAGLYRSRWGDVAVVELDEALALVPVTAPRIIAETRLEPLGDGRFLHEGPTGGRAVGEIVHFEEIDGEVVRMHDGDTYLERVSSND
jgi:CubicO group peptidase (beta-lactamase class C family)